METSKSPMSEGRGYFLFTQRIYIKCLSALKELG